MKLNTLILTAAVASTFVFAGCTVDKTKEGNLPDVDVTTKGKTELPEYDVKPATVETGMTTKTISVPTVDVNMPAKDNATPAPADSDTAPK